MCIMWDMGMGSLWAVSGAVSVVVNVEMNGQMAERDVTLRFHPKKGKKKILYWRRQYVLVLYCIVLYYVLYYVLGTTLHPRPWHEHERGHEGGAAPKLRM